MNHPGRNEQHSAGGKRVPFTAVEENASALDHYVDLVTAVGRLRIVLSRGVELHRQGPVAEQLYKALTPGAGKSREAIFDLELMFSHGGAAGQVYRRRRSRWISRAAL